MRRHFLSLFFAFAIPLSAPAEPAVFQENNFTIDLPAGWERISPPVPYLTVAMRSPDRQKSFLVAVVRVPQFERATSPRDFIGGFKSSMSTSGSQITSERDVDINGLTFRSVVARADSSKSVAAYVTLAGDEMYVIQLHSNSTDASQDAEMQSIANSFRLLSARPTNESVGYRIGFFIGRYGQFIVFGIPLLILIVGGIWIGVRNNRKR